MNYAPPSACSYQPDRQPGGFDAEIARLRAQVELSWDVERRRLHGLGVSDGQTVLEPGCGAGQITRKLAEWLPHSRIVALDTDRRMLKAAREEVGAQARVSFLQASVTAISM